MREKASRNGFTVRKKSSDGFGARVEKASNGLSPKKQTAGHSATRATKDNGEGDDIFMASMQPAGLAFDFAATDERDERP